MKKINFSENAWKAAGKLVKHEAKRADAGWPPACVGILHQPKRPTKK